MTGLLSYCSLLYRVAGLNLQKAYFKQDKLELKEPGSYIFIRVLETMVESFRKNSRIILLPGLPGVLLPLSEQVCGIRRALLTC